MRCFGGGLKEVQPNQHMLHYIAQPPNTTHTFNLALYLSLEKFCSLLFIKKAVCTIKIKFSKNKLN